MSTVILPNTSTTLLTFRCDGLASEFSLKHLGYAACGYQMMALCLFRQKDIRSTIVPMVLVITTFSIPALTASRRM